MTKTFRVCSCICGTKAQLEPRILDHTQSHTITHTHTHTHSVGLLWPIDQPVADAATHITHNKHDRRTSMSSERIRTRDPSNQAAADLCLRRHGHRNGRICSYYLFKKCVKVLPCAMLPEFFKSIAFWEVPRLRAFVAPIRAKSREDEYTALGEWYGQGKSDVFREERAPMRLCPPLF